MRKILLSLLPCLFASVFTVQVQVQAQVLIDENFESYGMGDLNGQGDWVAEAGAYIVTNNNEVLLALSGGDLMLTNSSVNLQPGDTLTATIDARFYFDPPPSGNFSLFSAGFQDGDVLATGDNVVSWIFYNNWENGGIKAKADADQWWNSTNPDVRLDLYTELGCDPKPNVGPTADPDADPVQLIYTLTKSDVTNEFEAVVTLNNVASNITKSVGTTDPVSRANLWSSTNVTFRATRHESPFGTYFDTVKVELTAPSAAPDSISALGLDGVVELSWTKMIGAAEYDLYKGTSPGSYGAPIRVVGNAYTDNAVNNGTPYYYAVEAVYYNGNSAKSSEAVATPEGVAIDQPVIATDFSGDALGDLADSVDWEAVSGSGSNAFAVITDGVDNKADSVATMADFDRDLGNAVYVDQLMGNAKDDAVEGYIDVVFSTTPSPGTPDTTVLNPDEFADFSNQGIMEFGISSSTTEPLEVSKAMMAMFHVSVRHSANLIVMFGKKGNDDDSNRLAALDRALCGWYPKDNAWNSDGSPADLETDPLRISFKIRKTREAGVYQAWASMSNLTTGATSEDRTDLLEFEVKEGVADMYDAPAAVFAMGHSHTANIDYSAGTPRISILNATVLNVDVTHSTGSLPVVKTPVLTSVLSGDREVSMAWEPVLDATGGYTITMETPNSEIYVVADGITETSYTDAPRWNDITNSYTLTANFDGDVVPNTSETNFAAAPVGMVPQDKREASGWTTGGVAAGDTAGVQTNVSFYYLDRMTTPVLENGVGGYTGPTLYGMFQCPPAGNKIEIEAEGIKAKANLGSWNNFGEHLTFFKAEDMAAGTASYDAVSSMLSYSLRAASWTWGEWNFEFRAAIRNGSVWYVSGTALPRGSAGGEDKPILIPDVMAETWYELTATPGSPMAVGAVANNFEFTDINAFGWYCDQMVNSSLYDFEVKYSGALPSYDYWTDSKGLVSSNSAPELDPDGDGIINEREYAFNGDPLTPDTATLPEFTIDSDSVTATYMRQRDPGSELTTSLKSTTDLTVGWGAAGGTETTGVIDYHWEGVTNEISIGANDAEFFTVDVDGL